VVRVDLHLHTSASFDCRVAPERMARRCAALGLRPIFVTDHDTLDGALALRSLHPDEVVVGQEIATRDGELIGLFLSAPVPPGLTARETASRIRDQGGLVYLEHPYDTFRRHLKEEAIEELAEGVDVVEVFNARSTEEANRRAEDLCAILGVPAGAGSDAHRLEEVGLAYVEMEEFSGAQDFLAKLREGRVVRRPSRLRMAAARLGSTIRRR
jgi:predicted metal-dependent phosphoesterase TrpH